MPNLVYALNSGGFYWVLMLLLWLGFGKIWEPVPFSYRGCLLFQGVYGLGTYRDWTAVGNVTNVVCISTPCSQTVTI